MAIGFRGIAATPSTGTADPAAAASLPASTASGDLVVMVVQVKASSITINTPTNWDSPSNNSATGGTGSGIDAGTVNMAVFTREYDGVWSMPTVDLSAAPNQSQVHAISYSKGAGEHWEPVLCANASDTTGSTTLFDPAASGTTISLGTGDWLGAAVAINGDLGTPTVPGTLTATGITFGTINNRFNQASTQGQDSRIIAYDAPYSSGTASAGPDTQISYSGAGASMCGAVVYFRLRVTPFTDAPAEGVALTAMAQDPTADIGVNAEAAAATAAAQDATVTTGGSGIDAPAGEIALAATAQDATVEVTVNAESAPVVAVAQDPVVSLAVNAEAATAAAAAQNASTDIGVNAQVVTLTATAQDASVAVEALAECATASAVAQDATVTTGGNVNANAEAAAASAVAQDAVAALEAAAEAALAAAIAQDPSLALEVMAEAGMATATAYNVTADLPTNAARPLVIHRTPARVSVATTPPRRST